MMNKLKLLSSSFIMALTLAAPFATYAMELEEDIGATASNGKRKAEEDKNPSKRTKPSAPKDLNAENALARLPSDVIDTISIFLDPNECFNLGLTCKSLGKHLPNLPMWQALIDRSELSQEESHPFFYKDLPKYYIFKMALSHNYQAKFTYAEWLLSHNLSQKVAARYLSEFIINTEAAPLKRCNAIHLIENFCLWNNVSDGVVHVLLSDIRAQHPQMGRITGYLSSVMSLQKRLNQSNNDYMIIYHMLTQSSQSPHTPKNMRTVANYRRAVMRVQDKIGDDLLTLPDAYQLLAQSSQSPQLDLRVRANYYRAMMRVDGKIGDDLLTLPDAYQLLLESSQNLHLPEGERAAATSLINKMKAQNRIPALLKDN